MNFSKTFLIFVSFTAFAGCSYAPVNPLPRHSVEAGAQHLNAIVEPSRPHEALRKCIVTGWTLEGSTTQNGDTFSGKSGIECAKGGQVVREFGENRDYGAAGSGVTEEQELARRRAAMGGSQ